MRDKLIDGYRGVAVLCVVAAHSLAYRFHPPMAVARFAEPAAEMGVQLFFVISGYIITTLLLKEKKNSGHMSVRSFYIRRCLRIIPPLWAYFAALFILRGRGVVAFDPASIASSAAFTCNTGLTNCQWWVAHTWSLAVEEQYYLVWPLLLTILPSHRRVPFLIGTIVSLLAGFLLLPQQWHSNWISFSCIAAGALYASSAKLRAGIARLSRYWLWLFAVTVFSLGHMLGQSKAIAVLTPALVLFVLFAARELPYLVRLLESAPLQAFGLCSYSLYIWQQLFLGAQSTLPLAALPVVVLLSVFLIERPFQKLGHRLSKRASTRVPAPAGA